MLQGAFHYTGPTGPRPLGLTKGKWNASELKVQPLEVDYFDRSLKTGSMPVTFKPSFKSLLKGNVIIIPRFIWIERHHSSSYRG